MTSATAQSSDALLQVERVSVSYGAVRACDDVSVSVRPGEIVGLAGPNGSGKTTLLRAISGTAPLSGGSIAWKGSDIRGRSTADLARSGVVRTFQDPQLFGSASVRRCLQLARWCSLGRQGRRGRRDADFLDAVLDFTGLTEVADELSSTLPCGLLRKAALAMALATEPTMILLDECAAGLNADESVAVAGLLRKAQQRGLTILVVDHDMGFLLPLVDRLLIMNAGALVRDGDPREISRDPEVVELYLGKRFRPSSDERKLEP